MVSTKLAPISVFEQSQSDRTPPPQRPKEQVEATSVEHYRLITILFPTMLLQTDSAYFKGESR